MKNNTLPFLVNDDFAAPLAEQGLVIKCTGFDVAAYQPDCYQQFNIPLPQRVSKAVPKRQAEFLAGRYCAARALSALGSDNLNVQSGENRIPIWPQKTIGSISHTAGKAVAVAGWQRDYAGVGIDCETLVSDEVCERIYDTITTPEDSQLFDNGCWQKPWFFTLMFSAKESLFKALYPTVNKYFGFDKAQLLEVTEEGFVIALRETLNSRWQKGQTFSGRYLSLDGYLVTLLMLPH
ncbi:4'-phosphopantetheinyl transferase superfamily protein [Porticoccus sp. W117]|uniref:4'-phosphopantetheinyl transferase family protein n=1 Tax=Porticoccus sp. W117 TaxID=3054777 RepID=UPI00259AAB20|nr:4'-phosphopantetheinyl transferase superfamily protein [Porticoccus sp. W117]MDM3869940.1 4'-phosphopantetheinyl transferase superfamily protein [Porticoccus sp. W117]